MRSITLKYAGECRKCGNTLNVGERAIYEKRVGIFCPPCAPTDPEEIRANRQEAANRKADKYEEWAAKRQARANATLNHNRTYTSDIAFNTQPGHIPLRAHVIAQNDRAYESLEVAEGFQGKADRLRHVRVAGDAERRRQATRKTMDKMIFKGSRVHDVVFGAGEVVGVYSKSYRIKFDRSGSVFSRDKSYIRPIMAPEQSAHS